MEQLLLKMARQLDAIDEASLLSLWEKYAALVSRFEPTKRWEEAALVLSLIQAKHWKNQLFNHKWAAQLRPFEGKDEPALMPLAFALDRPSVKANENGDEDSDDAPLAKILLFPTPEGAFASEETTSLDSFDSFDSLDSLDPLNPVDPVHPANPTRPTRPAHPANPVDPEK